MIVLGRKINRMREKGKEMERKLDRRKIDDNDNIRNLHRPRPLIIGVQLISDGELRRHGSLSAHILLINNFRGGVDFRLR